MKALLGLLVIFFVVITCKKLDVDLDKAKAEADKVANLVYQRYEYHNATTFQFFIESANMPTMTWDMIKYKVAKKIVDGNSTFLMIFGGSSVTAGHDNFYNESYPSVFERRMTPVFDALGIKLKVHNIAQGANNCRPSNLCYEAMGGNDADWIGWEQSFNCGRSKDIFELIARVAIWSKAVIFYMASGGFIPSGCSPSTDPIPWISDDWTPEKEPNKTLAAQLETMRLTLSPEHLSNYRSELHEWWDDGNSAARFAGVYGHLYNGAAPHGYSVWAHSNTRCKNLGNGSGCDAMEMKGECQHDGGPHWMVQETATYSKVGGKGRAHHPSAGMHKMRGEVLAYNYVNIVADAIFMVQRDLQSTSIGSVEAASRLYQKELDTLQVPMPEKALYLQPQESLLKPICYTDYEPHFNPKQKLSRLIIGEHPKWTLVRKRGAWTSDDGDTYYGYQDVRPVYEAKGAGIELHVRILGVRLGSVVVCGYSHKESLKHALFYLDPDVNIPFESNALNGINGTLHHSSPKNYLLTKRQYMNDECTKLNEIPNGDHVLTIRTDPKHPGHTSALSHIIVN